MLDEPWDSDTLSQHNSDFQDDDDVNQLLLLQNQQMSQVMMKAVVLLPYFNPAWPNMGPGTPQWPS